MIGLRRDEPTPLYYQLEMLLRRAIEVGEFPDGRLPTEEALAKQYGVSRLTVRGTLRRLEEDGLILRQRARGTFVCQEIPGKLARHPSHLLGFEDDLRRHGGTPDADVLSVEVVDSSPAVAAELVLPVGTPVHCVRRLGRVDGEPLWLERRYYPEEIGARVTEHDLSNPAATALLEAVLGLRILRARVRIDATVASREQARYLGVRSGHPLLVYQVTSYGMDGRPLQLMRAAYRGDRWAVTVDLPAQVPTDREAVGLASGGRPFNASPMPYQLLERP
jgi:GntR family transcriptional regulator